MNGLEKFGQININLYLTASQDPFRGSSTRFSDNSRDGKSKKGGARERLERHPLDFALISTMGKSAQDVTISTDVTSATSLIGCQIIQKSSQLSVEKLMRDKDVGICPVRALEELFYNIYTSSLLGGST